MYEIKQAEQPLATLPPQAALLPAVIVPANLPVPVETPAAPNALRHQQRFNDIIELRGTNPKPSRAIHRFFNGTPAWGAVTSAAAAALSIPLFMLGLDIAVPFLVIGAGCGLVFPGLIGLVFYNEYATPFSLLTGGKHLKEKDLAFLAGLENASPTERAVVGLLAERWMKRIDDQFVGGDAAFARVEDIATSGRTMPDAAQQAASAIVALHDAMVDHNGKPHKALDGSTVRRIVDAFQDLPDVEKRACAPQLMALYFKGEVPRLTMARHEDSRALYRVLRDGLRSASTPTP